MKFKSAICLGEEMFCAKFKESLKKVRWAASWIAFNRAGILLRFWLRRSKQTDLVACF